MAREQPGSVATMSETANAARRAAVRDVLADVSMDLFLERGFDDVSIATITTAVGVSVRTFYRYFPSKEYVLVHWALRAAEYFAPVLANRPTDEPLRTAVVRAAVTWSDAQEVESQKFSEVMSTSPAARAEVWGLLADRFQVTMAEAIARRMGEKLVPGGDADVLAAALVGVMAAATRRWELEGGDRRVVMAAAFERLERLFTADE